MTIWCQRKYQKQKRRKKQKVLSKGSHNPLYQKLLDHHRDQMMVKLLIQKFADLNEVGFRRHDIPESEYILLTEDGEPKNF